MKTKPLIIISILIAIFCAGYIFGNFTGSKPDATKTVNEADDGRYVAFIQEGSGRPIIDARCFLIQNDDNITNCK